MSPFLWILLVLASPSTPMTADEYLERYFKTYPSRATAAGRHEHDGRLPDWSADGIARLWDLVAAEELLEFAATKMAKYKIPRKVLFDPVMRNPTGKLMKPQMRVKYTGRKEAFKKLD